MTRNVPSLSMTPLSPLVGYWNTSGRVHAADADGELEVVGTDRYFWLPGGHFLEHRGNVIIGDDRVEVLEIIGPYDERTNTWAMRSYDSMGAEGVMRARLHDEDTWIFDGANARATLRIARDGHSMTAEWERTTPEGSWMIWMWLEFWE